MTELRTASTGSMGQYLVATLAEYLTEAHKDEWNTVHGVDDCSWCQAIAAAAQYAQDEQDRIAAEDAVNAELRRKVHTLSRLSDRLVWALCLLSDVALQADGNEWAEAVQRAGVYRPLDMAAGAAAEYVRTMLRLDEATALPCGPTEKAAHAAYELGACGACGSRSLPEHMPNCPSTY